MIDVAEYAGWVIAVRSGVCDFLSSARCRKVFIHRDGRNLDLWGVGRLDLCRNAQQLARDLANDDPDRFVETVLSGVSDEPASGTPGPLSGRLLIEARDFLTRSASFVALQHRPETLVPFISDRPVGRERV